jgi:transmembrane sensor
MHKLFERLEGAREHLQVDWSDRDELRLLGAIERRGRSRRRRRIAAAFAIPMFATFFALGVWTHPWMLGHGNPGQVAGRADPGAPRDPVTFAPSRRVVRLEDGSTATLLEENSELVLSHASDSEVKFRLDQGSAAFDVMPSLTRTFSVESAGIEVIVLGTAFTVERRSDSVAVGVQRGRVRVIDATGDSVLEAGEKRAFTIVNRPVHGSAPHPSTEHSGENAVAEEAAPVSPGAGPTAGSSETSRSHGGASSGWRVYAERGEFAKAYGQLANAGRAAVHDDVQDLLLAADAARLSGHPADSVPYLHRVTIGHRRDPRSALAAFTLGRVLLTQLGSPREAALAFADAQRLAPEGSLVEDALAREVEAWYRAGSADQAKLRASTYLRRFPSGRWSEAVRQYAGAE